MTPEQYDEIRQQLKEMREEMKPVVDTFNTLRALGKWTAVLVAFVGSLTALALGIKKLLNK